MVRRDGLDMNGIIKYQWKDLRPQNEMVNGKCIERCSLVTTQWPQGFQLDRVLGRVRHRLRPTQRHKAIDARKRQTDMAEFLLTAYSQGLDPAT